MGMDNYKQNVEAELIGMVTAILGVIIVATGLVWVTVMVINLGAQ